ncbi:hypothetical protein JQC67_16260 [Aurantibacter crassamenti]|uniref:hypothetical protein n=1 Tax=Aurantibacter crassamenti TaxID=1837375 RepID=UPI001939F8A9|nr:hypothetical protein [Aurantibacter crassamenti]MBM1107711.1 hypothetical protein [Aurantibacter crassamenti]
MNIIQSIKQTTAKASIQGENYLETSKRYFELKVFQQLTLAMSFAVKTALIGGLLFLALVFMLVGATIALGNYLKSMVLSTLLISLGLIILALIGYALRKKIDRKVIKNMASEFFEH